MDFEKLAEGLVAFRKEAKKKEYKEHLPLSRGRIREVTRKRGRLWNKAKGMRTLEPGTPEHSEAKKRLKMEAEILKSNRSRSNRRALQNAIASGVTGAASQMKVLNRLGPGHPTTRAALKVISALSAGSALGNLARGYGTRSRLKEIRAMTKKRK